MSNRRVVLDGDNIIKAMRENNSEIVATIVEVCDKITVNGLILAEYATRVKNVKALLAPLEKLKEARPMPKFINPHMKPVPDLQLPSRHKRLIAGAIRASADILITNVKLRGRLTALAETLRNEHHLRVISPDQYLSERGRTR